MTLEKDDVEIILGQLQREDPHLTCNLTALDDRGVYVDAHCEWTTVQVECVISYTSMDPDVRVMVGGYVFEGVDKAGLMEFLRELPVAVVGRRSTPSKSGGLSISTGAGRRWIGSSNLY